MTKKLLILPLALSLAAAGCDDMLVEEPESFVTTDTYYKSAGDIEAAVLSAYAPLRDPELLARQHIWFTELASDEARVNPAEPNFATSHPDFLGWDASSQFSTNQWRQLYRVNQRATLAIDKSAALQMDEAAKTRLVAEAKFLRALAYWYLVRIYGDVPLLLTEADVLKQDVARTPKEQVIAQILKDAQDAEAGLPVSWTGNNRGRATQGSARALQADVYIWTRQWQAASGMAKKIIDSGTYSLFPNYIDAFLPASKNGREHLFSVQATGVEDRTSSTYPTSFFPRELGFDQGGGWGVVQATPWFLNSYDAGDYRREVSFRTEGCSTAPSIGCRAFDEDKNVSRPDSVFRVVGPYPMVWKYRPTNGGIPQSRGDVDIPVYRYAEVLLWYAEAENELDHPAVAAQYLNMVRARARNGAGGENRAAPADVPVSGKDEMREAIFNERLHELAFESKRWFDMVRRGPEYVRQQLTAHRDPNAVNGGYLGDVQDRLVLPIPQTEINLNRSLVQNPGY